MVSVGDSDTREHVVCVKLSRYKFSDIFLVESIIDEI